MMAALATAAMTLGELFGSAAGDLSDVRIEDLVLDSRQVQPGVAFVAVPGTQNHGLDYLDDALARGAAVVVEEGVHDQDFLAHCCPRYSSVVGRSLTRRGMEIRNPRIASLAIRGPGVIR